MTRNRLDFSVLQGEVITSISINDEKTEIIFSTASNRTFLMYHEQDCCEYVTIEDICGDINDLLHDEILLAECVESCDMPDDSNTRSGDESETWTFYRLATLKNRVTIRWYGSSNGYYSESVDFYEVFTNND